MITSVDLAGYFPIKQLKPVFLSMLLSFFWCLPIIVLIGLLHINMRSSGARWSECGRRYSESRITQLDGHITVRLTSADGGRIYETDNSGGCN